MKHFATICSGIGAPEVAALRLGWNPVFSSEIETFPNAVREDHFAGVPNLGDMTSMAVRRLTPRECERLQGFPDDFTLIRLSPRKMAADGPRYKALGNSMAVPVIEWILRRMDLVDEVMNEETGGPRSATVPTKES